LQKDNFLVNAHVLAFYRIGCPVLHVSCEGRGFIFTLKA
jgi:hypothetical protein